MTEVVNKYAAARKTFKSFQQKPEDFLRIASGINLWDKQKEIMRSVFQNKRTAVKSGHKVGKTNIGAAIAITFLHLVRPSVVITTAPTWRQVEKQLWPEIHMIYNRAEVKGLPLGGTLLSTEYNIAKNHHAFGFSSEDTKQGVNFQGFSGYVLYIFDEAGGVPQPVWDAAETSMVSSKSRWLVMGNPHDPSTPFANCFISKYWNKFTISSWNTPNVRARKELIPGLATHEWCSERKDEWGEDDPRYQFRVLGEFPDASIFSMIKTSWLRAAQQRHRVSSGIKVGAVDVARFGDDDSVITGMDGGHIEEVKKIHGADIVQVSGAVAQMYRRLGWRMVAVDDSGVGGGVTDLLRTNNGINVLAVNNGEMANDTDHFENKGTETFSQYADDLRLGLISGMPLDESLLPEFTGRQYKFTTTQKMILESKKDFKKRLGRSPDTADSLILANWARRIAGQGAGYQAGIYV